MVEATDLGIDRISDLPDCLLSNILSFLPTHEAVRTCILSKRWPTVWLSLPLLKFDDFYFQTVDDSNEFVTYNKFVHFVNGVLDRRGLLPLDTFTISWEDSPSSPHHHVFQFILRALQCMPRVISVRVYTDDFFKLPDSIFTCETVEDMCLSVSYDDDIFIKAESINLPSLKKLKLSHMMINDAFIKMLFSGCPLLKELAIDNAILDLDEISSDVLNKLALDYCIQGAMKISCPGVTSLSIVSDHTEDIALKNMSSLVAADLTFLGGLWNEPFNHDLKLLGGLWNVTSLRLSSLAVLDIYDKHIPDCPALNNLTNLTLGLLDMKSWNIVACFLQYSPKLKVLTLHFCRSDDDTEEELDDSFQREYLETVTIRCENDIKLAGEVVCTLAALIKRIGKIVISELPML